MKKVLIVEPDAMVQRTLRRQLKRIGIEAIEALTLNTAQNHFARNRNDLNAVVLDHRGRGTTFDTLTLCREIKANFADKPIIAISHFGDPRREQMQNGCTEAADKDKLAKKLAEIL